MVARIGALPRKAEGTENEHEAEAFSAMAQRLATQHSIDLAMARAASPRDCYTAHSSARGKWRGSRTSRPRPAPAATAAGDAAGRRDRLTDPSALPSTLRRLPS
ncbi:DUF2786 domain-containing protein [Nocardia abscessus]|nr:DUF2786 domain-containing protein [Nocardia abscessus]